MTQDRSIVRERQRALLAADVAELIDRLQGGARDDAARDALLARVLRFQREHVAAYARIVKHSGLSAEDPLGWPGVPTDVFRFVRVAAHDPGLDQRVFRTSGTTQSHRGEHALRDLSLYDQSARAFAKRMLFPDVPRMRLVVLAPSSDELPDSSLAYMIDRFTRWVGEGDPVRIWRDGELDIERLLASLRDSERAGRPGALRGTSFAFVPADE